MRLKGYNSTSAISFLFRTAILAIIGSITSPAFARSECTYLSGDERRQCMRAEVQARTEANREAASEARAARLQANGQNRNYSTYGTAQNPNANYGSNSAVPVDRNAALAEREAAQAETERAATANRQAEADAIATMPVANSASVKKLEAVVEKDSKGWAVNHFISGSIHNVRVAEGSESSGNMVLRGEYRYANWVGALGGSWVLARFEAHKISCVQFKDNATSCRALRTPEDGERRRALVGAVAGAVISEGVNSVQTGSGSMRPNELSGPQRALEDARHSDSLGH